MAKVKEKEVKVEVTGMETKSEVPQHKLKPNDQQFNNNVKPVEIKHGILVNGEPHYKGEKIYLGIELATELQHMGKVKILEGV